MADCLDCQASLDSPRKKYCADCTRRRHRERERARYQENPAAAAARKREARQRPEVKERERAAERRYRESHRDQIRTRKRAYYQAHREERLAYWARYRKEHRDRYLASSKKARDKRNEAWKVYLNGYRKRNGERLRAHDRDRYRNDPARRASVLAHVARYKQEHRQRYLDLVKRHAHLRRGAEGHYTVEQLRTLLAACGDRCLACGATELLQVDHVVPLKRGGNNWITNLQPLCRSCNYKKHATIIDYRSPEVVALAERLLTDARS